VTRMKTLTMRGKVRRVTTDTDDILGVILAGGQSRRMGGNEKALLKLGNDPLIGIVLSRLSDQLTNVIINANGDPDRFDFLDVPVQSDIVTGFAGPLAGVHAGMIWARNNRPQISCICTVAADTPFFPADLVLRFSQSAIERDSIVLAASNGFRHPVFGLWPVSLHDDLTRFLSSGATGKVMAFVKEHDWQSVDFPLYDNSGISFDPFFNVNTPEELARAQQILELTDRDA
jgi:molybdenum cofactor guanylyltransferase